MQVLFTRNKKKLVLNVTRATCSGSCSSLPEIVCVAGLKKNRFLKVRYVYFLKVKA